MLFNKTRFIPALRMLPTEIRNDVENSGVRAFWVIFQNTNIYILKSDKQIDMLLVWQQSHLSGSICLVN